MPFYDIYSPDVRCGRGASTSGSETKTARVVAGDEVGFVVGRSGDEVCPMGFGSTLLIGNTDSTMTASRTLRHISQWPGTSVPLPVVDSRCLVLPRRR